ncbi:MAG: hypothetical protein AAGA65_10400 [Actinomycetota bacterium]
MRVIAAEGLRVPNAVAISVSEAAEFDEDSAREALSLLDIDAEWLIARSSGLTEDSEHSSLAGHYESLRCAPTSAAVRSAVGRVASSGVGGDRCAVILQVWQEAAVGGVGFSCDPLTFEDATILNWTAGSVADALAGESAAEYFDSRESLTPPGMPAGVWAQVRTALDQIAGVFNMPVDVEWLADHDNEVWFVQARPVVTPPAGTYTMNSAVEFELVPRQLRSHRKLGLRALALNASIPMAKSALHIGTRSDERAASAVTVAPNSAATTLVLILPDHLDGKIVREFSGTSGSIVEDMIESCQRYSIRRYPRFHSVDEAIGDVLDRGLKSAVVAAVLEGQILHATWTGVFAQTEDGYVVEMAQGHFVPKGIVETSRYTFDESGQLLSAERNDQTEIVHFVDGRVVHESPVQEQLHPNQDTIEAISADLIRFSKSLTGTALEFGVVQDSQAGPWTYLIDQVDLAQEEVPSVASASKGAISTGTVSGRLVVAETATEAHDVHFHSDESEKVRSAFDTIYLAESDSLSLLNLVLSSNPETTGFVFKRASLLSHLSIVLRERGIPAGVLNWAGHHFDGQTATLEVGVHGAALAVAES